MFSFFTRNELQCPEIGCKVRTDQTEIQCRKGHGCERSHCPLTSEFYSLEREFLISAAGGRPV